MYNQSMTFGREKPKKSAIFPIQPSLSKKSMALYRCNSTHFTRPLPPVFFSPCTKPLSDHTWNMLFRQPIPSYAATQRHWKMCKSLLWSSWKGSAMSRTKQPSNNFVLAESGWPSLPLLRPWKGFKGATNCRYCQVHVSAFLRLQ